ncbi:MAG: pirin family protein, partial [Vulcanimicrobiaceae bacterium]
IHSEMPAPDVMKNGGKMHGFQIWVNLPREQKMSQPRYQEHSSATLPSYEKDGRWVRVIAGEADGHRSPIETTVPTTLLHVKLAPDRDATFTIASGSNAIVHTIAGSGSVEGKALKQYDVALIENAPAALQLHGDDDGIEVLILAGVPLHEPVARYGPFVMSTNDELQRAFDDFRAGHFGEIARVT